MKTQLLLLLSCLMLLGGCISQDDVVDAEVRVYCKGLGYSGGRIDKHTCLYYSITCSGNKYTYTCYNNIETGSFVNNL